MPLPQLVTIDGVQYSISIDTTTYNAASSLLQSQPWWGNSQLSTQFASAIGTTLGSYSQDGVTEGPLFTYSADGSDVNSSAYAGGAAGPSNFSFGGVGGQSFTFAVATPVPESPLNPGWVVAGAALLAWRNWRYVRSKQV